MSTRSSIAIKGEGGIRAVYCHSDGYPEYNGRVLKQSYTTSAAVIELTSLGYLSSLDDTIENCSAYHRDWNRNWGDNAPTHHASLESWQKYYSGMDAEYLYLFENNEWQVFSIENGQYKLLNSK